MKNTTSGTVHSANNSGNIASAKKAKHVSRRDLSLRNTHRNEENIPELSTARNMAEQLEILEQHIAKASVVDVQRRNAIRQAIANGGYAIDPMSIASKFLKFEDDLYS